jgi:hypothetical protein
VVDASQNASQSELVLHTYSYFSDPSGPKSAEGYQYIAPNGTRYQRNWSYNQDGSPTGLIGYGVTEPVVDGGQTVTLIAINSASQTYSQQRTRYPVADGEDVRSHILGLASEPSEVRQALQSGVGQPSTTTVDGTPAIAISVPMPREMPNAETIHLTLYVDARTYQPLRTTTVVDGNPGGPYIADRIPATPDNIAKAKGGPIPAGYAEVSAS